MSVVDVCLKVVLSPFSFLSTRRTNQWWRADIRNSPAAEFSKGAKDFSEGERGMLNCKGCKVDSGNGRSGVNSAMVRLCLACIFILFLAYLAWLGPKDFFGLYHDDAVYFSSAQALAQGRGYIIPSFPGTPPQTKYPVLYPWLLSFIWRRFPSFPGNVTPAICLTALFGCWFLMVAFAFLRRLNGLGDWSAVFLVGLCALQPNFLFLSGSVLSDVPFAAMALTAAIVADWAMRRDGRAAWALAAGILSGFSVLTRGPGVAVVLGILAAGLYRRAFRQATLFCLATAPFLAVVFWPATNLLPAQPMPGMGTDLPAGFQQTLWYFSSYAKFWRFCVPTASVLLTMLSSNLLVLVRTPGSYFLFHLGPVGSRPIAVAGTVLTIVALAGIVRQARSQEYKPLHFVLLFYLPVIVVWNYALFDRFLIPFLPLLYAGVWVECRRILATVRTTLFSVKPLPEKAVAAGLGMVLIALPGMAVWNYVADSLPKWRATAHQRAALAPEKMEAYQWIRQNTDSSTRLVAYEDIILYLFTGRQTVPPVVFSTEGFFTGDERVWERDLTNFTDTARYVGARFWLFAADDFQREAGWTLMRPKLNQRIEQLKSVLPIVFRTRENHVQIYDLSCLLQPEQAGCESVSRILFPSGLRHSGRTGHGCWKSVESPGCKRTPWGV